MSNFFKNIKNKVLYILSSIGFILGIFFYLSTRNDPIKEKQDKIDKLKKDNQDLKNKTLFNSGSISSLEKQREDLNDNKKSLIEKIEDDKNSDLDDFFDKRGF